MTQRCYAVADRPEVRVHIRDLGLACCAVEFASAIARGLLIPAPEEPGTAAVLVISGTVTSGDAFWAHPGALGVVAAWGALGAVAALRWFRWEPRST